MPSPVSDTRGPLSWQQRSRLQRDHERHERIVNPKAVVALPSDLSFAQLRERLAAIVSREESLRVTEFSYARDSVTYSADVELPLRQSEVDSAEELDELVSAAVERPFPRSGGPLWSVSVVTHPDRNGAPVRSLCVVFDHLVTDGRSRQLFLDELIDRRAGSPRERGKYRNWVDWQLHRYPRDAAGAPAAARDFWRAYLDGTAPDRPAGLPFCAEPHGELSGVVNEIHLELPITIADLGTAAKGLKSSPFVIFLAAVSCTIGTVSAVRDVTLRVNTPARLGGYLDTLGYFAETVPVRVRSPRLDEPDAAVRATMTAWLQVLEHQTTPWDYVLAVASPTGRASTLSRPAQVLVNFIPWPMLGGQSAPPPFRRFRAEVGTFQLIMTVSDRGRCHLHCQFDPHRFTEHGVRDFLVLLEQLIVKLGSAR
ncbi:non-ribosomal peptide synthase [Saccharomonospora marina XMU15]|uniref:Non-ribosomal peptide synthase n=1 Tax=Saccharomonospora marina XMU15 TaxID=882083 RepID=H5X6Y9_9PSEU|nr:non-ribosomal peptide synthase [Saccharomonospora marina XMU15]